MIVLSAELRVKPGHGPRLEAAIAALCEGVTANEPGTLVFSFSQDRKDPDLYLAFEIYENQDALTLHGQSDYLAIAREVFSDVLEVTPKLYIRQAHFVMARPARHPVSS